MGTLLQLCLGTVYAWSYFQKPLVEAYGWSNTQVAAAFSLAICFLGLAAAWGGMQLPRHGPRLLAMSGGALFGLGYLLAALALSLRSLPLLYLGYGVCGGIGLGLGYVTPVATAAKWFPDRKGVVTGMVIMGFGFGALLMTKVLAPLLSSAAKGNLVMVFGVLGVFFTLATVLIGSCLRNPPLTATSAGAAGTADREEITAGQSLRSRTFLLMWLVFFCNIVAGISIIGFQSPLMQDLWARRSADLSRETLAAYGATLIAVSSIFNGLGRLCWGALSDRIGRANTFRIMLTTQVAAFVFLMRTSNPWLFGALICYVLLCYGGGFGSMPSFVLDVFGPRLMAVLYGCMLTAWSAAGLAGPQLVAWIKDRWQADASFYAFVAGSLFVAAGAIVSFWLRDQPMVAPPRPARAAPGASR